MGKRRIFTTEFKRDSAILAIDNGYSIAEACEAVGVGESAMRRWVTQLEIERNGETPTKSKAITSNNKYKLFKSRLKGLSGKKKY